MRTAAKLTIDGDLYEIHSVGATEGLTLTAKLAKLVLPAVGHLANQAGDGVGAAAMGAAGEALAKNLDAPEVVALVKQLLRAVLIQGQGVAADVFEQHFAGRIGLALRLCKLVIEHNGFFDGLADLLPSREA
jgi:hypothetical protein